MALWWLFLVDNTHAPELIVGAFVAVLGATAAVLVRQQRRVVLRPDPRWLLRAWRPLATFPRDMWLITRALRHPRGVRGRLVAIPIEPGDESPRNNARRVLLQSGGSVSPNTYVIGTDYDRGLLLAHQLVPTENPAADADPLGLR
jgi:multisubunit Na+/H+ antiporter MnhE subunit